MIESWRWYGDIDPIALDEVAQTGAAGIVTALHEIPYGEIWPSQTIATRKAQVERAGFTWVAVESLPVHERIKRAEGDLSGLFANYRQSLANLAGQGVTTVCYNFMPLLDWTRTDLAAPVAGGLPVCGSMPCGWRRLKSICWDAQRRKPTIRKLCCKKPPFGFSRRKRLSMTRSLRP